jgi:hypothetical protein
MANTYTTGLKLVKPGLNDPGWGTTVNDRLTDLVDQAVVGSVDVAVTSGGTTTLPTIADGLSSDARNMTLVITGSLTSVQTATVRVPATVTGIAKLYSVINSAGGTVTVETSGGASVAVPDGRSMLLRVTSAGVYEAVNYSASFTVGSTLFAPKFAPTGGTATGNGMYLPATNTLAWSTNGVEGMRLDASGNLGIGTISPTFKLVAANNSTDGGWMYSSSVVSVLGLGGYSAPTDGTFQIKYDRATGTTTFNEGDRDTPTALMALDGSGNLSLAGGAQTTPVVVTFSATAMTVNCNLSNVFTTTFTANVTVAPTISNPHNGQTINWFITQDATGSRTMTWPASFKWPVGSSTALSTAANSVDLVVATYISSTGFWYASLLKGFV